MSAEPSDSSPGWKPDPLGTPRLLRHWDGARWTSRTITREDLAAGLRPREELFEDFPAAAGTAEELRAILEVPKATTGTALPEWERLRPPVAGAPVASPMYPTWDEPIVDAELVYDAEPVAATTRPLELPAANAYRAPSGVPLTALGRLAAQRASAAGAQPAPAAQQASRPAPPVAVRLPVSTPTATLPPGGPPEPLVLGGVALHAVGPLRVYVCGITPYDVTHLGHAATYLWTDLACRVVRAQGTRVVLTRNVSDIDTPLLAEARRRGMAPDMLGTLQRASFDATMATLGVRTPDAQPTAATSVGQVQTLVAALVAKGTAYVHDGTVWARTAGAAAGMDRAAAVALLSEFGQDGLAPGQQDQLDVPVWLAASGAPDEPAWPSPWGAGRPGWHAECAAMVLGAYGSGVDLHAGGADLRYPHHACEAHLAEVVTGVAPFARAWLHAGTVMLHGTKMAKSTGNLVLVDDLLRTHSPAAVRLLCLARPYGESWDFTPGALDDAARTVEHLTAAAQAGGPEDGALAVDRALLAELDVPLAVEVALDGGGPAARRLLHVAGLA